MTSCTTYETLIVHPNNNNLSLHCWLLTKLCVTLLSSSIKHSRSRILFPNCSFFSTTARMDSSNLLNKFVVLLWFTWCCHHLKALWFSLMLHSSYTRWTHFQYDTFLFAKIMLRCPVIAIFILFVFAKISWVRISKIILITEAGNMPRGPFIVTQLVINAPHQCLSLMALGSYDMITSCNKQVNLLTHRLIQTNYVINAS